jgi:hypothetical protein
MTAQQHLHTSNSNTAVTSGARFPLHNPTVFHPFLLIQSTSLAAYKNLPITKTVNYPVTIHFHMSPTPTTHWPLHPFASFFCSFGLLLVQAPPLYGGQYLGGVVR